MTNVLRVVLTALVLALPVGPALAQTTTLTMSSWVSPQHHLTGVVLQGWANEVEKATNGRVKFTMLPKHPSAPPGTFDAVRDGLVDLSYVTASYTPARHILPLMPELPGAGDTALVNSVACPSGPLRSGPWLGSADPQPISVIQIGLSPSPFRAITARARSVPVP